MPLYEFQCQECQDTFEVMTSYRSLQNTVQECVSCGSQRTARLLSQVSVIHRGPAGQQSSGPASSCSSCSATPSACSGCGMS